MNNVLFIDKPKGMTSFDICNKLRKILHTKKIGHTGTLDPLATGVMIILFDNATKANQFLVCDNKTYVARVMLGINTDTLDTDGNIIDKCDFIMPDRQVIIDTLDSFKGQSMQQVPITSAVKINGKKLYEYQRQNIEVELPYRTINISDIELKEIFADGFSFICTVSSGTYIRALVRDILCKLNLVGCLSYLRRLKVDDISVEQCDSLDDVLNGHYHTHDIYDLLIKRYPYYEYDNVQDIKNGKRIVLPVEYERVLIINNGKAIAIYDKDIDGYKCVRGLW